MNRPLRFIQLPKEKTMQKVLKRFMLIGAISLSLSPVIAHSQAQVDEEAMQEMLEMLDPDFSQKELSDEMLEGVAKFTFEEEIQKGKLSSKQATAYVKCAQKDYGESYSKSPEAQKHKETMQQYKEYLDPLAPKKMSAEKKAAFMVDFEKARKVLEPLQEQSEERCMKKLGLKVPRGKVWGRTS
jgi:hypothetical protein